MSKQRLCTTSYDPVCAKANNGASQTFSNSCTAVQAGAKFVSKGECPKAPVKTPIKAPAKAHCLTVFDNPDIQVVVSFNKTLVGKDFSSYLGCWEVNDTYQCGEIPMSSDGVSKQKLLTIVLPVCLTIFAIFSVILTCIAIKRYRLKKQIRQQQQEAVLKQTAFNKARDLEMGIQSHR